MKYSNAKLSIMSIMVVLMFIFASVFAAIMSVLPVVTVASAATSFESVGRSAYLVDYSTGSVIYARNETDRHPIASMVKIMTALLTFEAIERGDVTLDDDVEVSEEAASMGGSQVFLDAGTTHRLGDLLKSVIVASANDSCVALAEHIEGSVGGFVSKMNARAKELGMNDTSFKNCTGLPAAESFSCAKDVAAMFSQLIKHPTYFEYANVWLEDYKHPDGRLTSITNTNKLVKFYKGCDGGKTGFTNEAKFCLSATAMRQDMRVIAVMMGADSAKERNAAVSAMFDYAFANYSNEILLKAGENLESSVEIVGGKKANAAITVEKDVTRFSSRQDSGKYELRYEVESKVKAPVRKGDVVGKVYLLKDGVILSETNVVVNEDVERMSLFDAIGEIGKHWSTQAK